MAVCRNEVLLNRITKEPIEKETVVTLKVLDELPDCKRIIANTYYDVSNMVNYKRRNRPTNRFECEPVGCLTGTLYLGASGSASYKAEYNATEFANGIMTFYVKPNTAGAGSVTVTLSDDSNFTNADVYTVSYTANDIGADGYVPIVVDLSKEPTSEAGTGWTATDNGTYFKIQTSVAAGISSISFFDSIEDFAVNDTVQVSCISTFDGTDELSALEAECSDPGYDTSDTSPIERTLTGKLLTPNYEILNPRGKKGDKTVGFEQITKEFTVSEKTVTVDEGTDTYGVVVIADKAADECGFLKAQLADACEPTESELQLLTIPTLVDIEEDQYLVIPGEDGSTEIIFNEALIGEKVLITYPKKVQIVDHRVYSINNVEGKRVDMSFKQLYSDGTKKMFVYHNVLITSFPVNASNEENEFEFTFSIPRSLYGVDYESWRIIG